MPGASPVQMALLPKLADGAFRAFVRFPPGWSRNERGYYAAAEEFIVLEGELALDERRWSAGGYAWIAPMRLRTVLRSDTGCLVFACFSSPPRWTPGEPSAPAVESDVVYTHWREAPGHRLHGESRVISAPDPLYETLGLESRTWSAPGSAQPQGEPLFARKTVA